MPLRVTSPYDGAEICELPFDEGDAIERKAAFAYAAQDVWSRVPLDERISRVRAAMGHFRDNGESIAEDVTRQMGKPITQSRGEVATLLDRADHMLSIAPDALATDVLDRPGFVRRIEHAPLGVVLDIAAWNYPLIIAVNVVVPALLAGNAVIVKHSAKTPLCGRAYADAFAAMEPAGLVQDVILTHEATAALIGDRRIAHVSFTGSTEGGRSIYASAAARLMDAGLELGGKDPAYVAEDADLDTAVESIVDGACYNAGQSCCAVERVYVHESVHDAFIERARSIMEQYRLGNPLDEDTTMGPLASAAAHVTLESHVRDATRRGARVLLGGGAMNGSLFWLPTLLIDVPNDALIMQEESFGPLLPVMRVADDEEAQHAMDDTRYGLTASVWTTDTTRAERMARDLDAGTIFQNRCDYLDPALPWTGCRDSGLGSTLSRYGFLHLTKRKAIHFKI
ncbi:MAG: aldehyde dehydrogenase family protein [Planctomycetes bacterium]|nr:aldehyde dehydrogenase family protein [Planctomycetota bacterium]